MEKTITSQTDNQVIHYTENIPPQASALMILVHGMSEHRHRYDTVAKRLNQLGYGTIQVDLRGHGESLYDGMIKGHFADKDGYLRYLEDLHQLIGHVRFTHPKQPLLLFGHSMGSLFVRALINQYPDDVDAVLISGPPAPVTLSGIISPWLRRYANRHPRKKADRLARLVNQRFLSAIKNPETPSDWLSVNKDNVQAFCHDPNCGFSFTYAGYADLVALVDLVYRVPPHITKKTTPILIQYGATILVWMSNIEDP